MSDFPSPLAFGFLFYGVKAAVFFLDNILWFGVALYGALLWRRTRRHLAALPVAQALANRDAVLKAAVIRFGRVLGLSVVLYLVSSYATDFHSRRSASDCKRSAHGPYVGEACAVAGGDKGGLLEGYSGLLSLYDAQSGELLARTFVPNPESGIYWEEDEVWQRGSDENGTSGATIQLPPTTWDRFKATLP